MKKIAFLGSKKVRLSIFTTAQLGKFFYNSKVLVFWEGRGGRIQNMFPFLSKTLGRGRNKKTKKRAVKSFDQIVKRIFVPHLCKQHNKTYPKSSDPGQTPSPQKQQKQKEQKISPRGNVKNTGSVPTLYQSMD